MPSMHALDNLSMQLAKEHGLRDKVWSCLDERREAIVDVLNTVPGLSDEQRSYLRQCLHEITSDEIAGDDLDLTFWTDGG